eukprot:TRINITY_DN1666_c0_g1_i1.p4 TRINITY_DN1666_c0_g1~~TRINITY_DN1666_c0_g1_i1.p4  ORF type:complete len:111 (+),score=21.03 TRINITY_DN1666_c0_g1_i1:493-825(+)
MKGYHAQFVQHQEKQDAARMKLAKAKTLLEGKDNIVNAKTNIEGRDADIKVADATKDIVTAFKGAAEDADPEKFEQIVNEYEDKGDKIEEYNKKVLWLKAFYKINRIMLL